MSDYSGLTAWDLSCEQARRGVSGSRCNVAETRWLQLDEPELLLALTAREALIAAAIFDRMFPSDERNPGAREIGALTYLDRALAGAYREHLPVFRNGLALLDSVSRVRYGAGFASAAQSAQDDLIGELERGSIPDWVVPDQSSFLSSYVRICKKGSSAIRRMVATATSSAGDFSATPEYGWRTVRKRTFPRSP